MLEEPLAPLHFPNYLERPAFVALIGCIPGILAFRTPFVLRWCLAFLILGALAFGLSYLLSRKLPPPKKLMVRPEHLKLLGVVFGIGAAYGWYAAERGHTALTFQKEMSLKGQKAEVLYPVAAHASSPVQYTVRTEIDGEKVTLLLRPEDGKRLPMEYAADFTADLKLRSIETPTSYNRYLLSEGYTATGYFVPTSDLKQTSRPAISSRLQAFRERIVLSFLSRSDGLLSESESGLIFALSLGDRSRLPKNERDDFTNSGLAHVMAVSGYHLGIIYALLGLLLNRLLWCRRFRSLRYFLLFLGVFLYTLLTGASTATVRALVMTGVLLFARIIGRRTDVTQVLSLTMLIFLVANPFSYLSVGLLLSLSAVWGILTFLPLFQRMLTPSLKLLKLFRDAFFVTVSAQMGLFPLLFLFFQKLQLSLLWSNIPVVLLSALLIPFGFLLVLLTPLIGGLIPDFVYLASGKLAEWILGTIRYFGTPEMSLTIRGDWDGVQVWLVYGILFGLYYLWVSALNRKLSYQK